MATARAICRPALPRLLARPRPCPCIPRRRMLTTGSRSASQHWGGRAATTAIATALLVGTATVTAVWRTPTSFYNAPAAHAPVADMEDPEPTSISYDEVQKHTTADDCWVIIDGNVYDMTNFLERHPGGAHAILSAAGKDATRLFSMLHAPDALSSLPPAYCLGPVDLSTLPDEEEELSDEELARQEARDEMPSADAMFLLDDFEFWAERVLAGSAWAYYRSASDHEATFHENKDAYRRYFFRPRILRDMSHGDTDASIVGIPVSMPVLVCPAAMAKLGHPLGEINLTKAAGSMGVIQIISANASCSLEEIFEAKGSDQTLFYQVYLNKDRRESEKVIKKAETLGAKAIVFTVDCMRQTKRTMDVRAKAASAPPKDDNSPAAPRQKSVSESISGYQDWNLTWGDIDFIRGTTKLPIIVKGVQSVEDVQLCAEKGVEGVILSNHGGRQADYAPAPIDILYELRATRPELFGKIDIMVDGGVRSGADVVKALALGAKAVGLGRPFMYANGTHGEEGVTRALEILHEEITNTMRNIGANRIQDLKPSMVGPAGPWVGANRPPYLE